VRYARGGLGHARQHQPQAKLAPARFRSEALDARREALADELENEPVGRREDQRIGRLARLGRERPDPRVELLRGELLLEPAQASIPEVLHLFVGPKANRNFTFLGMPYPQTN